MLDAAFAYDRFKFLGDEFLTWLWFIIENDRPYLKTVSTGPSSLAIGNRIVLENRQHQALESITIKGDDADFEEGVMALRKGAVVTEMNLCFKSDDREWRFTVKGESLNISGFKTPFSAPIETMEEIEGAVLEKAFLYDQALQLVDKLFNNFIKLRVSPDWQNKTVPGIRKWMSAARAKDIYPQS
jgi:hypothetical protein